MTPCDACHRDITGRLFGMPPALNLCGECAAEPLQTMLERTEKKYRLALADLIDETEPHENLKAAFAEAQTELARYAAREASVLGTIGGTVEGNPTHSGNWLQRIRELVDAEEECRALRQELADTRALCEAIHVQPLFDWCRTLKPEDAILIEPMGSGGIDHEVALREMSKRAQEWANAKQTLKQYGRVLIVLERVRELLQSLVETPPTHAVRAFQRQAGVAVDGVAGNVTFKALDEALRQRKEQSG